MTARLLTIIGSGEIAPGMAAVHRAVLEGVSGDAVMLDTPFGFQENADELVAKIADYFSVRLGVTLRAASLRDAATATDAEQERFAAAVEQATYVFAGPGSPTYALRQWLETPLTSLLTNKLNNGGCVVFASAAAITLGAVALPVYEIYKVGEKPEWRPGLDVLAALGIKAAVIPHFDNAEGGTHDTRFCYLGERRLTALEAELEAGTVVIGVDEHTAVTLDADAQTATVRGRGALTLRRDGAVVHIARTGETVSLDLMRGPGSVRPAASPMVAVATPALDERADAAFAAGDVDAIVAVLLDLDSEARAGSETARSALRRRIVRFGEMARRGTEDPRERIAPFVDALIRMRGEARTQRRFDEADTVRQLLVECGIEVRDTADGVEWRLHDPGTAS